MNKTVTINLGGVVFHIDENAYDALTNYLNAIKSHFSSEQGCDEILNDIESRIGEMFSDKLGTVRQVIILSDVEEVTGKMGKPEQFLSPDAATEASGSEFHSDPAIKLKRRMYRNTDDEVIGGVCSGIASYFDVDPVWVRLAFVLAILIYGVTFWIYIILWIILPEAKTTADKLMMKGEPVTVSSIERNVKEELESVKQRLKAGKESRSVVTRFFDALKEIVGFLFKAIGKIIAVFFLVIGLIVGIALFVSLFGLAGASFVHYPDFLNYVFNSSVQFGWIYLSIVLLVGIPFIMLAYAGARILFNIKRSNRAIGLTALALWLIGLGIFMFTGLGTLRQFSETEEVRFEVDLKQPENKKLIIESDLMNNDESNYTRGKKYKFDNDEFSLRVIDGQIYLGNVKLDIVKSATDSFELVEIFSAKGKSGKEAAEHATRARYSFTQTDSVLNFDNYFILDKGQSWRNQKLQLLLRIPIGGMVRIDKSAKDLIYDIDNIENIYDSDMINRTWIMTGNGLACLDCTGEERSIDGSIIKNDSSRKQVRVNHEGVRIENKGSGDKVIIDSTGIHITKANKKVVEIDKHGMRISPVEGE